MDDNGADGDEEDNEENEYVDTNQVDHSQEIPDNASGTSFSKKDGIAIDEEEKSSARAEDD